MTLLYIDVVILIVLLYINYRKYKFSTEFGIKQNTGLATIFVIVVLYGISIPAFSTILVKFSFLKSDSSEFYLAYKKVRLPFYWVLGMIQFIYLIFVNQKVIPKNS